MTHTKIFLIRHGETDWNLAGKFQGHIDIPLNETGRNQALRLCKPVAGLGLDLMLSSDLLRAKETGKVIQNGLGKNIHFCEDARLREAFLGQAEGMTDQEMLEVFGEEIVLRWRSGAKEDLKVGFPGGETGEQVLSRSLEAVWETISRHGCRQLGVATHGGVIRRWIQSCIGSGWQQGARLPIFNGTVFVFDMWGEQNIQLANFFPLVR